MREGFSPQAVYCKNSARRIDGEIDRCGDGISARRQDRKGRQREGSGIGKKVEE